MCVGDHRRQVQVGREMKQYGIWFTYESLWLVDLFNVYISIHSSRNHSPRLSKLSFFLDVVP